MKVAARRLLEEQITVVVVLESGYKDGAMWHVPQSITLAHGYSTNKNKIKRKRANRELLYLSRVSTKAARMFIPMYIKY